jgi:hypothetical protein
MPLQPAEHVVRLQDVHREPLLSQGGGIVAHSAEQQHQFLALVGQAVGALAAFDQQYPHLLAPGFAFRRSQGRVAR